MWGKLQRNWEIYSTNLKLQKKIKNKIKWNETNFSNFGLYNLFKIYYENALNIYLAKFLIIL